MRVKLVNPKYYRSFKNVWRAVEIARVSHGGNNEGHGLKENRQLLKRLIVNDETSVLEHMTFTFHIKKITRSCLQELVRHRHASYTVLSTRFTLKKVLNNINTTEDIRRYFYCPDESSLALTHTSIAMMKSKQQDNKNDDLKTLLTENMYTELYMTINLRSLLNFLDQRYSNKAHPEIKKLAYKMASALINIHPLNTFILDSLEYYSDNTMRLGEELY